MPSSNRPKDTLNKKASFEILINNKVLSNQFRVNSIITKKGINKIGRAFVEIFGGDYQKNEFLEVDDSIFELGNEIVINAGYDQSNTKIFEGVIESASVNLKKGYKNDSERSFLKIECVDKAIKLTNSYTNDLFEEMSEDDIINYVINKVDGLDSYIENIGANHDFFSKYDNNDWEFIVERAKINSMVVLNTNNKLSLVKPSFQKNSELTVSNSGETYSFSAKQQNENQIKKLTINAVDSFNNERLTKDVIEPNDKFTSFNKSDTSTLNFFSPDEVNLDYTQDLSLENIEKIGSSKLESIRYNRIIGESSFRGVPSLDIDSVVTFEGFGSLFDGEVYVTHVSHSVFDGNITTKISFGLTISLFNDNKLTKNKNFNKISGLHIARVSDIETDPKNQYRVKVIIPELKSINTNIWDNMADKGIWAKLSHLYVSEDSGFFFIPEIGTQVLVSFISDNPTQPVVIGCLYNNDNKPYKEFENTNKFKAIVSKNKMMIEFDEENEILNISTPKGNQISIDENNSEITIKDENQNEILTSSSGISLKSNSDIKLNSGGNIIFDATSGISINSSGGDVSISGTNINNDAKASFIAKGSATAEVSSSAQTTIKGSMVMIN